MKIFIPGFAALFSIVVVTLFVVSCTKIAPEPVLKTRLLITLRDDEGKRVDSALVTLYKNGVAAPVDTLSVDSTGIAYFPDLAVATYHWTAAKGCKTNLASQQSLNKPLIEGMILYGYSVLSSRAVLKIENTTANTYTIADSTINVSFRGDTTLYVYPKIGTRTFHFEPADTLKNALDTVMEVTCGDTAYLKLPF